MFAHGAAGCFIEKGRRGLLDDFLMAALQGAFTLAQIHRVAKAVRQHLDLDVAGFLDIFLDEHAIVAKAGAGLVGGAFETIEALSVVPGQAHALAATAGTGFDHHRIADSTGYFDGLVGVHDDVHMAGNGSDTSRLGQFLGGDFIPHAVDGMDIGGDENNFFPRECFSEGSVLGQKAIAGMDRFGAGVLAGLDNTIHDQIALGRRWWADEHGFVRHLHMERILVGL